MAATKKTAVKKVAVRKTKDKTPPNVYVVSERSKLFTWTPVFYSDSYNEANNLRKVQTAIL